ncbi:unnamed protein product [Parajaminaea phylloscopi]
MGRFTLPLLAAVFAATAGCELVAGTEVHNYSHSSERASIHRRAVEAAVAFANEDNDDVFKRDLARRSTTAPAGKRGLAYNDPALTLPFNGSQEVTWAYNWYSSASGYLPSVEYVPMLWSNAGDLTAAWAANVEKMRAAGSKHVIAFNEPDLCVDGAGSSCMSIADAVTAWKTYMEPLKGTMLLGAPAVTNSGPPGGVTWLSQFMGNCTGCHFDFIPLHWYSNKWAGLNYLQSHINSARAVAGGRPLWLTEFGLTESFSATDLTDFLTSAMDWLDAQSDVERYAYFWDAVGANYLIASDGVSLSPVGTLYRGPVAASTSTSSTSSTSSSSATTSSTRSTVTVWTTTTTFVNLDATPTSPLTVDAPDSDTCDEELTTSAESKTTSKTTSTSTSKAASSNSSPTIVTATALSTSTKTSTTTTTTTTKAAATTSAALEVLSAYYATTDVTSAVRSSFLKNGGRSIVFSPTNLLSSLRLTSDPWPGKNNTLTLLYKYQGTTRFVSFTASSAKCTITSTQCGSLAVAAPAGVSKPSGSSATLVAIAWGGRLMTGPTLWNKFYQYAASRSSFQLSQGFIGSINPMPNQSKAAVVWYNDNAGRLKALVAKQNDLVQFPS